MGYLGEIGRGDEKPNVPNEKGQKAASKPEKLQLGRVCRARKLPRRRKRVKYWGSKGQVSGSSRECKTVISLAVRKKDREEVLLGAIESQGRQKNRGEVDSSERKQKTPHEQPRF